MLAHFQRAYPNYPTLTHTPPTNSPHRTHHTHHRQRRHCQYHSSLHHPLHHLHRTSPPPNHLPPDLQKPFAHTHIQPTHTLPPLTATPVTTKRAIKPTPLHHPTTIIREPRGSWSNPGFVSFWSPTGFLHFLSGPFRPRGFVCFCYLSVLFLFCIGIVGRNSVALAACLGPLVAIFGICGQNRAQ